MIKRLASIVVVGSVAVLLMNFAGAQAPSSVAFWPQWRGPNHDGVSRETGLLKAWPNQGPRVVWEVNSVGVGYSSIAIKDGLIYTQGDLNGVEHIICLSVADGSVVWAVQPEPVKKALDDRLGDEFKKIDRNSDGAIDEAEALARFGTDYNKFDSAGDADAQAIAAKRSARLVALLDKDGDGAIDLVEAGSALGNDVRDIDQANDSADKQALADARANAAFAALDKDKDGKLSRQEARNTVIDRRFGEIDRNETGQNKGDGELIPDELASYFVRKEPGRDGRLTAPEFTAYFAARQPGKDGQLTALELRGYDGGYRNGRGDGPRGTPTIDNWDGRDVVYTEGGNGDVTCLDASSGKTAWHISLSKDLGGGRPGWGYSESPLVDGNMLIVTPGGKSGTIAMLDKKTGKVIWQSEGFTQGAQYSSPVAADIAGTRQIVQFVRGAVIGVDAKTGKFLWKYDNPSNVTANCATPIVRGDFVFGASAYGTGGGLAKIAKDPKSPTGWSATEIYFQKKMQNHHGGIVLVGEHMYGFGSGGLICMDFKTGEIKWSAGSVGKGSLTCADGMLYCLGEGHQMGLVEANPSEYVEKGRFRIESLGLPSWAHPVVAGGRLYIRNQQRLTAYDVKEKAN